ncbi:IS1/IS1595 family N-terminal zinc-binding domain-containing protein [Microbacterium sp. T32]|uniref:IS1/IS1595 family N-terminal zinc-binding domain-containing protein n=1 Tax=Microbacterium sp. T32 TaxID=1776083 RepID=UPI003FA54357
MDLPSNPGSCVVCGSKLVKNGRHPSGTQRWRCRSCGSPASVGAPTSPAAISCTGS